MPKRTKQKAKRVPLVFAIAACAQHYADAQANVEPLQSPEVILSEFSGERVNWCLLAVQLAVKKGLAEAGTFKVTPTGGAYLNTVESKRMLLMGAMRSKLDDARVQMAKEVREGKVYAVDPVTGDKIELKPTQPGDWTPDGSGSFTLPFPIIEKTDPFNGMTLDEVADNDKKQREKEQASES